MSFPASSMPGMQGAGALQRTAAIRQRVLNYLQRLFLICDLTHQPADSFSRFITPVETFTTPWKLLEKYYTWFCPDCQFPCALAVSRCEIPPCPCCMFTMKQSAGSTGSQWNSVPVYRLLQRNIKRSMMARQDHTDPESVSIPVGTICLFTFVRSNRWRSSVSSGVKYRSSPF